MSSRRPRPSAPSARPLRSRVVLLSLAAASLPMAMAQSSSCVSLAGSTECPAFSSSSISTDSTLTGLFPFLTYVSDTNSFDQYLAAYVQSNFVQQRYVQLLGCSNINLDNTTDVYARYTTSVLCNAIVQNSIDSCDLSAEQSRPLCADTCAEYAISEQEIAATPELCGTTSANVNSQIRADFTNCALPANSLTGSCITGVQNEPENCGYLNNLQGLCSFCASSSPNATDSCCNNSNVNERCQGVDLPTTTSMSPLFPSSTTAATGATGTSSGGSGGGARRGLSPGQIAGIVVGAVLGAGLLLTLMICACVLLRRRRASQAGSVFNQPSPSRGNTIVPAMSYSNIREQPPIPPTGRVARMNALEDTSSSDPYSSPRGAHRYGQSDGSGGSPRSMIVAAGRLPKRNGSLSSSSRLNIGDEPQSPEPNSNEEFSSPEMGSGQSEQLPFFKDYYSQDEVRPGDSVAVLWAYQPRASDEFELERGEMIKVMGIWDDGWATGMKITQTADEWDANRKIQRDSGMSNGSQRPVETVGEVKAFPLVCVCLPQHWRKTIDGDSSAGDSDRPPTRSP